MFHTMLDAADVVPRVPISTIFRWGGHRHV